MRSFGILGAAAVPVLAAAAAPAFGAAIVNLSVVVNQTAHTYDVYANIPATSTPTQGLFSTGVNITSDGNITVGKPVNLLPAGSFTDQGTFATIPAGFTSTFVVPITGGWEAAGTQGVGYQTDSTGATAPDGKPIDSLVKGFGNQPGGYIGDNPTFKYYSGSSPNTADLARIAHGTYTGTAGDIFVASAKTNTGGTYDNSTLLLPAVLPPSGTNLGQGETYYADAVTPASAVIGSVPEPASLGVLGVAGLGLVARRRRA